MSYLWHLDGLSMALGIGNMMGTRFWYTGIWTRDFFHTRFFWTRIARITRIFLAHGAFLHEVFGTRISLSRILCSWCLNTNLTNNTNFIWHTDIIFFAHGSHSRILSLRLVVNDSSLWLLTRCGYWLIVVIDSLWLLTCCGYWLVVV